MDRYLPKSVFTRRAERGGGGGRGWRGVGKVEGVGVTVEEDEVDGVEGYGWGGMSGEVREDMAGNERRAWREVGMEVTGR